MATLASFRDKVAGVNKRVGEERESVNAVHYRIEMVAYRGNLDLDKSTDRVAAQAKVFEEDPVCMSATEP